MRHVLVEARSYNAKVSDDDTWVRDSYGFNLQSCQWCRLFHFYILKKKKQTLIALHGFTLFGN